MIPSEPPNSPNISTTTMPPLSPHLPFSITPSTLTIVLFFTLGVLCYFDRTNLAFAAIQLTDSSNNGFLSCREYSISAGIFFLSYAAFQVPAEYLKIKLGTHLWLTIIVIIWGLVAAAFSLANSAAAFYFLRLLLGAAECGAFPGIWSHLAAMHTEVELGPAYAKVATSTALAQVLGAPIAGAVLHGFDGVLAMQGWRWLFLIEGLATCMFGLVLYKWLPKANNNNNHHHHHHNNNNNSTLENGNTTSSSGIHNTSNNSTSVKIRDNDDTNTSPKKLMIMSPEYLSTVKQTVTDWRVLYLGVSWFLVASSMYGVIFFLTFLIRDMFGSNGEGQHESSSSCGGGGHSTSSSSDVTAVFLSTIPFAAAAAAMVINADWALKANERNLHSGVPIILGGLLLMMTPLLRWLVGPVLSFSALIGAAAGIWAFHGPFMSWPAEFMPSKDAAGIAFALINSMGAVGGFFGPMLLGYVSSTVALSVLGMLLIGSGVGLVLFNPNYCISRKNKSFDQELVPILNS